jgi:hypothetical protein
MNLIIPGVGTEPGPDYATDINNSLTLIDQHDHTSGYGVPITPAGLNINAILPINNNIINNIKGLQLTAQPSASSTNGTISVTSGGDLYYTNYNGAPVPITNGNSIAGSPGSISGLSAPAGAAYSGGVFTWTANGTIRADMDFRSATFRNNTAGSFGMTIAPPASLTADYTLVMPLKPASATSFLTIDTSGNITPGAAVLGALTTANLSASAGILGSQIATNTITTSNISLTAGITGGQIASNTITGSNIQTSTITNSNISSSAAIVGTKLETNPTFNGTKIAVAGPIYAAMAKNNGLSTPLQILRGLINSGGSAGGGEGFSSGFSSTGVYVVTFTSSFSSAPIITASVVNPGAQANDNGLTVSVKSITTSGFVIQVSTNGTPTDSALNFIAIGL